MGWTTGVQFPTGAGIFSLRHRVHTSSVAHPASYQMGTDGRFPWDYSGRGVKPATHFQTAPRLECVELNILFPLRLHGVVFN
jgi:hypothetical protein